jgi:outer membrane protein
MRRRLSVSCAGFLSLCALAGSMGSAWARHPAAPTTLAQALAEAYADNPTLQEQRANLRATDENVPAALAGWRPSIEVQGSAGRFTGTTEEAFTSTNFLGQPVLARSIYSQTRDQAVGQITVTQPIFRGGQTVANVHQAKNSVYAGRAQLLATEESVFLNVVNAYVAVVSNRQVLALDRANEQVLGQQLKAVTEQFHTGALTMLSVAQSKASLAQARVQVEVAEGNLRMANTAFARLVGAPPAANLALPQPLELPVRGKDEAARLAARNNPSLASALFNESAARDAVDAAIAKLAPQLSLQASAFDQSNPTGPHSRSTGGEVLANLTVPLYQGGSEYAAIRQARDKVQASRDAVLDARRTAVQQAEQAWQGLIASRAAAASGKVAVKYNAIALDATEREELVGTRTTLDVLNAQEALVASQVQQVQNVANMVNESYSVASAIGRLTATDLGLPVTHYDDVKYYRAVKDALAGNGNLAYQKAGIAPNGDLLRPAGATR